MVEAKTLVNILKFKCFITKTLGLPIIRLKYLFLILGPPFETEGPPFETEGPPFGKQSGAFNQKVCRGLGDSQYRH